MNPAATRRLTSLALLALAGSPAAAQLYLPVNLETKCSFSFGIPSTWTRAQGKWFGHGWARTCNQWLDQNALVTPWGQSGQPAQLPGFAMYGADTLLASGAGVVNHGYPAPWVPCFPANPYGSVPAQLGTFTFPPMGTTHMPGGFYHQGVTATNGYVRGDGHSEFIIGPYGGTNVLDGQIRSYGGWMYNSLTPNTDRGYGFSFTELRADGIINPQYHPPTFWGGFVSALVRYHVPPSPPGGWNLHAGPPGVPGTPYQPPYLGHRVYDPIRYTVTDTVTGQTISGVIMTMYVDLGSGTSVDAENGMMTISGPDASVRIEMSDPRVTPQGTYQLDIRNGMVVTSSATGVFASQFPPPVGSMTPQTFFYPGSLPFFSVDLNGFTTNPMKVELSISNGGPEPVPELTCAKIGLDPASIEVCEGQVGSLTVGAHGTGTLTYQWQRRDGAGGAWPVFDGPTPGGGTLSGSQTGTLTLSGASFFDAGEYQCMVTDICGVATSQPASINITPCAPSCYANCDGSLAIPRLTPNDFQCFLNSYAQGDSYANCDGSNSFPLLTPNDFQCFLNAYASGCS